ncbi:hypothetical protein KFK09_021955 [Dendrobium nobile]|uniref:Uncharacterized protein n=1 Tax=Dendrobium nobile TaxID=94219 RepID=A0A8T3AIQ6_DENNO|nr:hypothetical protein KFK09_021955 [Dendrobium nobile]
MRDKSKKINAESNLSKAEHTFISKNKSKREGDLFIFLYQHKLKASRGTYPP